MPRSLPQLGLVAACLLAFSGCLNNTDGYFALEIRNDLDEEVRVVHCDKDGGDCSKSDDSHDDLKSGESKPHVVGKGHEGTYKFVSTRTDETLGCIPWAFDVYLEDEGTVFKVSQMVGCDQHDPIEPYAVADPVEDS